MSINFHKLKRALEENPKSEWEGLVENSIKAEDDKSDELSGTELGFSVDLVELDQDCIQATVFYLMIGEATLDEDGSYQNENGDSYDIDETEYFFALTITETSTTWSKE